MNKSQNLPGTAIVITEGLIPSETAKLRRHIEKLGGIRRAANIHHMQCYGQSKLKDLKDQIMSKQTQETSIYIYYVTAKQMADSIVAHGKAS